VADDISSRRILADMIVSVAELGREDTSRWADLDCTTDLSGTLPDNLSKVAWLRVLRVVLGLLIHPSLDSIRRSVVPSSGSKVLSSARMLELTLVRPVLGFGL